MLLAPVAARQTLKVATLRGGFAIWMIWGWNRSFRRGSQAGPAEREGEAGTVARARRALLGAAAGASPAQLLSLPALWLHHEGEQGRMGLLRPGRLAPALPGHGRCSTGSSRPAGAACEGGFGSAREEGRTLQGSCQVHYFEQGWILAGLLPRASPGDQHQPETILPWASHMPSPHTSPQTEQK